MNDIEIQYQRIIRAVKAYPWAIMPAKLAAIQDLLRTRAAGHKFTPEEIADRLDVEPQAAARGNGSFQPGATAVIPIVGTIIPRGNMFAESSGAVSIQRLKSQFRSALSNADVDNIIFDIDSPGGSVAGVEELAKEIYQARGTKPVTAVANSLAASAAYWIGTAADELVVTPSGQVGSIGVLAMHEDISELLTKQGVKVELIHAGKYKVEGNPFQPLDDEARGNIQAMVDMYYDMFVTAVSRQRSVSKTDVRNGFGEGRVVGAKEAVKLGMADRVATFDDTLARLQKSSKTRAIASVNFRRRRLRHAARTGSVETG
jgi:signal peptide peptidase SppA